MFSKELGAKLDKYLTKAPFLPNLLERRKTNQRDNKRLC